MTSRRSAAAGDGAWLDEAVGLCAEEGDEVASGDRGTKPEPEDPQPARRKATVPPTNTLAGPCLMTLKRYARRSVTAQAESNLYTEPPRFTT
jgi:hypothetical protein